MELICKIGAFLIDLQYSVAFLIILLVRKKKVRLPKCNGPDVFLLMNGPSLTKDLSENGDKLCSKNIICVNMMVNLDEFDKLKPRYYAIADIKFWQQMNDIDNNEFLKSEQNNWDALSDSLVNKTNWEMYLFLPDLAKSNKKLIKKLCSNKNIHIIFLNTGVPFRGFDKLLYWTWKNQLCLPELINVLVLSIYVSVLMKYKNIYLLGCDHSFFSNFHVDENNKFYFEYNHLYDSGNSYKAPYDSFGKEYTMKRILKENASLWEIYEQLEMFSKINKSNIFNCTSNSLIDVFRRKKLSEVLDETR